MSRREQMIPSLRALGADLDSAAVRELGRPHDRRARRPHRRLAIALVGALLVLGGVAGAGLIVTGDPVPKTAKTPDRYKPGSTAPTLVLSADDPVGGLPWGVQIYDAVNGSLCSVAGRLDGRQLGAVQDGVFRPFTASHRPACARVGPDDAIAAVGRAPFENDRTLAWGRAGSDVRQVELVAGDERRRVTPGAGGAFLFVLAGRHSIDDVRVRAAN